VLEAAQLMAEFRLLYEQLDHTLPESGVEVAPPAARGVLVPCQPSFANRFCRPTVATRAEVFRRAGFHEVTGPERAA
jgi:hypothetical protein